MTASDEVALVPATPQDAPLLENLLQLYIHDMSEIFPIELRPDGRFGYDRLQLYWLEPQRRFAFLIRAGACIAGFALVTRGSPVSDDPEVLDLAEFFVLRRFRRSAIGRRAAASLWDRLAGAWTVRVSEGNRAGLPFWSSVIAEYTGGRFSETTLPENPHPRRVFSFDAKGGVR